MLLNIVDLETAQRGYIITGHSAYLESYSYAIRSIDENFDLLQKPKKAYSDKLAIVDVLKRVEKQKMDFVTGVVVTRTQSFEAQGWYSLISDGLKYSGKTENPAVEIGSFLKDNKVCYYVRYSGRVWTEGEPNKRATFFFYPDKITQWKKL